MKDFDKVKSDASKGVLFTKFAQSTSSADHEKIKRLALEIGANHELWLFSDHLDDTKDFQYRCAVFIDNKNKQIICANAGTRLSFSSKTLYDLSDDFNLYMQMEPAKLQPASRLNTIILDNLGRHAKNYTFSYTGHSLGGVLADLQATDMHFQMQQRGIKINSIGAITFDNPGAKEIVEQMFHSKNLDPSSTSVDHICINNRKNFFNSINSQVGQTFEIEPDGQRAFGPIERTISLMAQIILSVIKDIAPSFVIQILSWVSYGSLETQIEGHKLSNFEKVFVVPEGQMAQGSVKSLDQILERKKLHKIDYDKTVFAKLKILKGKNGDIGRPQKYIMKDPENQTEFIFSQVELKKALTFGTRVQKSQPLEGKKAESGNSKRL